MPLLRHLYLIFSASLFVACAEPVSRVEISSLETSKLSLADFVGEFSVYEKCPNHDWNTGILRVSQDYISITETGCKVAKVTKGLDANSLLLDLTVCHAEGEPMPDERAKLTMIEGERTLQYLPNADGIQSGDGRIFKLTPCSRDTKE